MPNSTLVYALKQLEHHICMATCAVKNKNLSSNIRIDTEAHHNEQAEIAKKLIISLFDNATVAQTARALPR